MEIEKKKSLLEKNKKINKIRKIKKLLHIIIAHLASFPAIPYYSKCHINNPIKNTPQNE